MAKRITSYRFSSRFKKQYKSLPREIQHSFNEKLVLFLSDMHHPSLRTKRIQGTRDRWEGSITMKYRFTFHFDDDTAVFRSIGTHDILSR